MLNSRVQPAPEATQPATDLDILLRWKQERTKVVTGFGETVYTVKLHANYERYCRSIRRVPLHPGPFMSILKATGIKTAKKDWRGVRVYLRLVG